jgi:DNA-binding beta-propeller fold protein YncE
MSLAPGARLGPYEILAPLGAGGMGEVYRARDTRLNRDVAIKVLPAVFAQDADRLARLEREARAIAALSHPNILAIHDIGTHNGQTYVVAELLVGETLRDRLRTGALPMRKAIDIAAQVARGLGAAHDKALVHRDLKPENLFLLKDGQVKILDFGLAKTMGTGSGQTETVSVLTDAGTVLGTVGYMAPEQVLGQTVDARADLFALGAVLYEMFSGQRAFKHDTAAGTMAAILRDDPPDLSRARADLSPALDGLVRHCLEKQPAERFQSARDLAFALQSLSGGPTTSGQAAVVQAPALAVWPRLILAWSVAVALLTVAGATWWALRGPVQDVWTGVRLGGPMQAFGPRLSPDEQLLAFVAFVDQLPQVAIMKPDGAGWTVITRDRTHGFVTTVAWAPDGSRIYFDRMGGQPVGVYSVPPLGGEPRPLLADAFGPEALSDGSLIVLRLTDQGDEQLFHYWPDSDRLEPLPAFMRPVDTAPMLRAFPDGRELVFFGMSAANRSQAPRMLVYTLATRTTRELEPGVGRQFSSDWAPLDVSPDGRSVYFLSDAGDTRLLLQVPRTLGKARVLLSFASSSSPISLDAGRDGSLYLDQLVRPVAIVRAAASGASPQEFTVPTTNSPGRVMPDGEVLLLQPAGGTRQLSAMRPGSEPRLLVNTPEQTAYPATIFGDHLAFTIGTGNERRIALASIRDGRVLRRYSSRSEAGLAASPDGEMLYYSFAGGIWAQPVTGGEPIRITDGEDVVIEPTGQHLYVKRTHKGTVAIFRVSVRGTDAEELPLPPGYQVGFPPLSPAAVDARGRILVSVLSQSFYYRTALLDPATKTFTLIPIAIEGDVADAGWAPDGSILATTSRYMLTLWRYRRASNVK